MERLQELKKLNLNAGVFSIYDADGTTTQELLCQFQEKINNITTITNATIDLMEYLVDVGLQEEIAEKLVQWLEDGTLDEIINNGVLKEINERIDETLKNIEHQSEEIENIAFQIQDNFEFLKQSESFNIKFYGAVGNGVEDDTEAFKKAIYATSNIEAGKTIFLPASTYVISENIEIPNDVSIIGEANTTIQFTANNIGFVINGSNIEIKDIVFEAKDVSITDIIKDSERMTFSNIKIKNCKFQNIEGSTLSVINLYKASDIEIENCVFNNIKGKEVKCINSREYVKNINIKNNTFSNIKYIELSDKRYSIYINSGQDYFTWNTNATIHNNTFDSDIYAHILIDAMNVTISNNTFNRDNSNVSECHFIKINNTKNTKIKNNFHNLKNDNKIFYSIVKVVKGQNIHIDNENLYIEGQQKTSNEYRHLFDLSSSDVTCNNIVITGKHQTHSMFNISNMKKFVLRNSVIDIEGTCDVVVKKVNIQADTSNNNNITIENNNIECTYGSTLLLIDDTHKNKKVEILNNTINAMSSYDNSLTIKNADTIQIKDNNFKGSISLYDFSKLVLSSNTFAKLLISADKYDVISQNNTFIGKTDECYLLSCHSQELCNFVSKNNYNQSNTSLIKFYSNKGNFLIADNMNIQIIDDINSQEVQELESMYIERDSNITVDIYTRCYIKTQQSIKRITYYTTEEPLLNYRKPNGAIILNATTGQASIFFEHNGQSIERRF